MLQEAEYSLTNMAFKEQGKAGDEQLLVKFYLHPRLNAQKSDEAGRPIYDEVEYISIKVPGSRNEYNSPAKQRDKDRFPEHYRRFKERIETEVVSGTLLEEWPVVSRSQVEELRFFNIRTVEQLASSPDSAAANMTGFLTLKQKAKAFLELAAETAAQEKLQAAEARIAELERKLEELATPRRGRRKKVEPDAPPEDSE